MEVSFIPTSLFLPVITGSNTIVQPIHGYGDFLVPPTAVHAFTPLGFHNRRYFVPYRASGDILK